MGRKEPEEAEPENGDDDISIAPMQVNLHGMIPFYRNWYRDKLKGHEHDIHHNFMDILEYLVQTYVPEYDEAIGLTSNPSDPEEE